MTAPHRNQMHPKEAEQGSSTQFRKPQRGHPSTVPTHLPRRPSPALGGWGVLNRGLATQTRSAPTGACVGLAAHGLQGQTDRGRPPKQTKLRPRCPACRSEPGYGTQGRGVVAFTSDTIPFRANSIKS